MTIFTKLLNSLKRNTAITSSVNSAESEKFSEAVKVATSAKVPESVNIAQASGKIKRIIPNENFELVVELRDGSNLLFQPRRLYDCGYNFLAYPHRLKHYNLSEDSIIWHRIIGSYSSFNGGNLWDKSAVLEFHEVVGNATAIDQVQLANQNISLGMRNQAPTKEHNSHHVYAVSLYPYNPQYMFCLVQSICGGFGDHGPVFYFSLNELIDNNFWKTHFELSGCLWAVEIVESLIDDKEALINKLVTEVCVRAAA